MKRMMHSFVRMERNSYSAMCPIEPTTTDLTAKLQSMNAKIVPDDLYAPCVQKRKRETIEKYISMKSGNLKKNTSGRSFQMRKLVKFTVNVKSMWSQSSDF